MFTIWVANLEPPQQTINFLGQRIFSTCKRKAYSHYFIQGANYIVATLLLGGTWKNYYPT